MQAQVKIKYQDEQGGLQLHTVPENRLSFWLSNGWVRAEPSAHFEPSPQPEPDLKRKK